MNKLSYPTFIAVAFFTSLGLNANNQINLDEVVSAIWNPSKTIEVVEEATAVGKTLASDVRILEKGGLALADAAQIVKQEQKLGADFKTISSVVGALSQSLGASIKKTLGMLVKAKDEGLDVIKLFASRGKDFAKRALNEVIAGSKRLVTGLETVSPGFTNIFTKGPDGQQYYYKVADFWEEAEDLQGLEEFTKTARAVE